MLREQFDALVAKLVAKDDKELMDSVNFAIESCGRYVEAVNAMEAVLTVQKFRCEPEEYREKLMEADKRRRNYHNGLIANVTILNRICVMVEVAPVFKGDTENRIEIAEFAMEVVAEMFGTRKL